MDKRNRLAIAKLLRKQERYYRAWLKEWAAQVHRAAVSDKAKEGA